MAEEIKQEVKEELKQPMDEVEIQEPVKEEKKQKERIGVLCINTGKNNTMLTLNDMAGNTLLRATGGQSTKQARLKSSPTVAMFSAKKIGEEARELGITGFYIRIKGEAGGQSSSSAAHAVVKALTRDDFRIISILDITKMPRGGPKRPGGRRGRRV